DLAFRRDQFAENSKFRQNANRPSLERLHPQELKLPTDRSSPRPVRATKRHGIFAGSAQLRHSTIQMTARHYTNPRQREALPLGICFRTDAETHYRRNRSKTVNHPFNREVETGCDLPTDSPKQNSALARAGG